MWQLASDATEPPRIDAGRIGKGQGHDVGEEEPARAPRRRTPSRGAAVAPVEERARRRARADGGGVGGHGGLLARGRCRHVYTGWTNAATILRRIASPVRKDARAAENQGGSPSRRSPAHDDRPERGRLIQTVSQTNLPPTSS